MADSTTYSVILSGKIKTGFEPEAVTAAFAKLFKLSAEKAGSVVGTKIVLKHGVELQVAKTYKDRLDAIGLEVALKRHGGIDELALEPAATPPEPDVPGAISAAAANVNGMVCPKCELEQPKADQCSGCGVFVHKVKPAPAAADNADKPVQARQAAETAVENDTSIDDRPDDLKMFIAPLIAAVLGAVIWYLIAISLEYEFSAVAWLIGGAIGYAAITSGASGNATGVVCAALVVVSICGGKYMAIASFQSDFAASLSNAENYDSVDLRAFYEEELHDAGEFAKLAGDDASLRNFLVVNGYSDYSDPAQVPDDEIDGFRDYTQPRLEEIYINRPNFEEWREYSLAGGIEDLPTFDLMVESLDWMDMLFLFFGIGTAYRLASHGL